MPHTKAQTNKIITIVVIMVLVLGFNIDLYTPSFPAITSSLKTNDQLVQLTISICFLGYVIGMLILGPISDAFGRKKPLMIGVVFYCIMSLLCAFAESIHMLLIFRFLQGMAIASIGITSRSILGDSFTGKRLATSMTYYSMSYRIGPIIAPLIGGYLQVYLGWRSNFIFLMLYGLVVFCTVTIFLPETHHEHIPFHPKLIFRRYVDILKNLSFIGSAFCIGVLYATMIIFNVIGPFFIQSVLNYSPIFFGHIAFIIGVFSFAAMFLNRLLLHRVSPKTLISIGMHLNVCTVILQTIFSIIFPLNLYVFIIPVILVLVFSALIVSNMMSHAIDIIPKGKGSASAVVGMIIIFSTAVFTALSSFLKSDTIRPFSFAYLGLIILCYLSYQFLFKKWRYHS